MLLSTLFVLAGFAATAHAQASQSTAPAACVVQFETPAIQAEICQMDQDERIVQITFTKSEKTKITVHALFRRSLFLAKGNGYQKMWDRFWVTGGMPRISRDDQKVLIAALNELPPSKVDDNLKGLSDFLVSFVEPNARMENFDSSAQPAASKTSRLALSFAPAYTSICEFRGQVREATYTVNNKVRVVFAIVGQPENKCRGRCGTACSQFYFQWSHDQYTQECLNHDACRDETGQIFGQCADEFWAAAAGYVSAPDCAPLK